MPHDRCTPHTCGHTGSDELLPILHLVLQVLRWYSCFCELARFCLHMQSGVLTDHLRIGQELSPGPLWRHLFPEEMAL